MKNIGLLFGSFNPIHIGHIKLAKHFIETTDLKEIWFVVTPKNPFKKAQTLLNKKDRLKLVNLALKPFKNLFSCDIEFLMTPPNYTINTLNKLKEQFPSNSFCLLIGEDILSDFHKWKNYNIILKKYKTYVYPRSKKKNDEFFNHDSIIKIDAPIIDVSSTFLRKSINKGEDVKEFIPIESRSYIEKMKFYQHN